MSLIKGFSKANNGLLELSILETDQAGDGSSLIHSFIYLADIY